MHDPNKLSSISPACPQTNNVVLRRALIGDSLRIMQLYFETYEGSYPDPTMNKMKLLREALSSPDIFWILGDCDGKIVGSIIYKLDSKNLLAKVYGAVVDPQYRGFNLTQKLMTYGYEILRQQERPVDLVYATTRTVTQAPQKLTAALGYKKIGIFPNVHKTEQFETHGLTALITKEALHKRFVQFELHPQILGLFEIVRREFDLPRLKVSELALNTPSTHPVTKPHLECIQAAEFVRSRFYKERGEFKEHHWFFPFEEPNILLTSPDQQIEIFASLVEADRHCVLIGIRDMDHVGYESLLNQACLVLWRMGVRYIEFIMRADESEKIQTALDAKFIPCGYFPALQLSEGVRYDFVIFSRSFEILDFSNVQLEGVNRELLKQYFDIWKKLALDPAF